MEYRIALAQLAPRLGDMAANLELAADWLRRAAADGAQLTAFPELALTGYLLFDLVPEVAIRADDPRLAALSREAPGMLVAIGFVEETDEHRFANSAALLRDGELVGLHRKVYLPTYGSSTRAASPDRAIGSARRRWARRWDASGCPCARTSGTPACPCCRPRRAPRC